MPAAMSATEMDDFTTWSGVPVMDTSPASACTSRS